VILRISYKYLAFTALVLAQASPPPTFHLHIFY
jgi:hypothetical protein